MLKFFMKWKYRYHRFQHQYLEMLKQDCLNYELRMKLMVKSTYHNSKAIELGSRI